MGRSSRHDGPEGLNDTPGTSVDAAIAAFEREVPRLARTPSDFIEGVLRAQSRLLAPLRHLERQAALGEAHSARAVRRTVEAARLSVFGDPALFRVLVRARDNSPAWRQLYRDFTDAGALEDAQARATIAKVDAALYERTDAFAGHHRAGPHAHTVRVQLARELSEAAREALWAEYHAHAAAAAGLCRDILSLRRQRARAVGFANYAGWVDRDAAFASVRTAWLDAMTRAARVRARAQPRAAAPWNEHKTNSSMPAFELSRTRAVAALTQVFEAAGIRLKFDVAARPNKPANRWAGAGSVYASLPAHLDADKLRVLLHESGHAADELMSHEDIRHPTDSREISSTLLEPFGTDVDTLTALGATRIDRAVLHRLRQHRLGRSSLRQLALARADHALHAVFDPQRDGSPLPWARRIYAEVEGSPRDVRDATVATHEHLFARAHGYAARYATYPLGDLIAEHHWAHRAGDLGATLERLVRTLWTDRGRLDPRAAIARACSVAPSPAAFVRAALA